MALAAYFGSGWVRLADGLRATQIEHQSSVIHQDSEQLAARGTKESLHGREVSPHVPALHLVDFFAEGV
jgi:hypothetical protein